MATIEKDAVSGQNTTGHEWDGIKELNTPLPKWWVYVFWVSVIWAVGYWIAYPAWPTASGYSRGLLNYSSRGELDDEMAKLKQARSGMMDKIQAATVEEIEKNDDLRKFAMAGGKVMFGENCSACHGPGGSGREGYPALVDDEWIWGGTAAEIENTIAYGVRNTNPKSRAGEMPKFGTDKLLTAEQIAAVSDYVVSVSARNPVKGTPGAALYADNCVACHGEDGTGNKEMGAPSLNNAIWLFKGGKEGIAAQVAAPKHGSMPAWSERLDAPTIKMLAVFVHTLGGGK